MRKFLLGIVFVGLIAGTVACIWLISARTLTSTEALLLSLFLTLLSMLASWLGSWYYAEVSLNRNLRFFALKAAEKVTNLSNELQKLSAFLEEGVKDREYDSVAHAVQVRDQQVESAIHILGTLKSINDGSLSDWQGVIGEEIKARREEQEEREEGLKEILTRVESVLSENEPAREPENESSVVAEQLAVIKRDLRSLTMQVSGVAVRSPAFSTRKRETIQKPCPACGAENTYKQRPKPHGMKSFPCGACGQRLVSRFDGQGYTLSRRERMDEQTTCPSCDKEIIVQLDEMPGASLETPCPNCQKALRISRNATAIRTRMVEETEARPVIDANLLELVVKNMPPQPWPKGAHRAVAEKLGVSPSVVTKAIDILIERGIFKPQVEGKLFVPEKIG